MNAYRHVGRDLYCENVSLAEIAERVGTPFYVYSHASLTDRLRRFDSAFAPVAHIIAFAMKANSNLAILRLFAKAGCGADIVSGGELYRALAAGMDPKKIVFAGVGKTADEIRRAMEAGILMFNVESAQELEMINAVAEKIGARAPVALRVNPNIDPKTHPYISTGLKKNKFGIAIEQAVDAYRLAERLSHIEIVGIHKHIGSQLTQVRPFVDALKKILKLIEELKGKGIAIRYLNLGGGLGITYDDEKPPEPRALADAVVPLVADKGFTLVFEPGRFLVGNAGALVTRTLYLKQSGKKNFVIVDAAMNDLVRPSFYDAYHEIRPVVKNSRKKITADVVGPICESSDFLAKDRVLAEVRPGELLAVMSAGAYGFSMASNYNARPRVAEILVRGESFDVIRKRESLDDLIRGESIPAYLA